MKILFFIHRFPGYGGIETVTTVLSNYFIKKGFEVGILSFCQEDESLLNKLNNHISLFRFPDNQKMFSQINVNFLDSTISEFNPDVIINQESYSGLSELLLKLKNEISSKILTVEHNTPDARYKLVTNFMKEEKVELQARSILKKIALPLLFAYTYYREFRFHRILYKKSNKYVLLSDKFIPIFKKISHLNRIDKIQIIQNPVTINTDNISTDSKEKIVLYVGRLDYGHKRVDRLIRIWDKITKNAPGWKLLIVGDGPDRGKIETFIADKKIENIVFEGLQYNVVDYYSKASILCLTSTVEGWPLVLAEAMASGCVPILYNSFASAADIVSDGVNGILIQPYNENNYAKALLKLITENELREELALKAVKDSTRFSLEKIGEKWLQLLNEK